MLPEEMYDLYLQDLLLDLPETTLLVMTFKDYDGVQDFLSVVEEVRIVHVRTSDLYWRVEWDTYVAHNRQPVFVLEKRFVRDVHPHLKRLVIVPPDGDPFVYTIDVGRKYYSEHILPRVHQDDEGHNVLDPRS